MKIINTDIEDVLIIESQIFGDHRGWFTETYSKLKLTELGIDIDFVQDNHSMSLQKGTLRGLHFQKKPYAQTKLIRCTKGAIYDVAVDLRKGSPTYKKWVGIELTDENKRQLLIPKGFAHGFLTLTDDVEVQYKVDEYYRKDYDRGIRYDDPDIGIMWKTDNLILSDKDSNAPYLKNSDVDFTLKYLVTGSNGQLGHDVIIKLKSLGYDVIAPERNEFDLTNNCQVHEYILSEKPDVIIHCAAYTAVDNAEDDKELCYSVNVEGTRTIATAASIINAKLLYISTDYVFDGSGKDPHSEDKDTKPVNYYGYTKERGEIIVKETVKKHFILRTSWVYGINGNNFVKTMLRIAESKDYVNVVNDQIGSPTYTKDLAELIVSLLQTEKYGTYHGTNNGYCSWYDFAKKIFAKSDTNIAINPVTSNEYITRAARPLNSRLANNNVSMLVDYQMPHWENALDRFIDELKCMEDSKE